MHGFACIRDVFRLLNFLLNFEINLEVFGSDYVGHGSFLLLAEVNEVSSMVLGVRHVASILKTLMNPNDIDMDDIYNVFFDIASPDWSI